MFIPLIYGLEKAIIDTDEKLLPCPICDSDQWSEILVSSEYVHFYHIPIYPSNKDVYIHCKKCGHKRYGVPINAKHFSDYREVKRKFKHPWYTYIGITIIATPFILLIIFGIINSVTD